MKNQTILVLAIFGFGIFGVFPQEAIANIVFNDGQIHDINYHINDSVEVDYWMPGVLTTVNLLAGGTVRYWLGAHGSSRVNILDGLLDGHLHATANSEVNVGGGVIGTYLTASDWSLVRISGGTIGEALYAFDNSRVEFTAGWIGWGLHASGDSQVTFSGGSMGSGLFAQENGVLTVIGSDFAVDGQPFGYGELLGSGRLTGMLASGDMYDNGFWILGENARIVLAPGEVIPAPGSLLLSAIGVGIVGWLRRMDVTRQTR